MHCLVKGHGLYLGVAVAVLAPTAPSFAQGAEGASSAGDIIVTARRVEERLQDVPISITVYSQEQIADRNITIASDLATYTPSLSVNQRFGPEKASFAIRGFNQDIGTSPSVGVYFAEVVVPRAQGGNVSGNTAAAGSFMDLQNVQVLKGPQGTLFGRNTTGGAVLLVPNRPTDRLEGYVEGSVGNYDMRRAQGVFNVPLADTFKVRLAVDRNKREGYMKNHSGIGPDDYNDTNYFAARLSILAELTPDLENYMVFAYSNSFSNGLAAHFVTCVRNPALRTPAMIATVQTACDQIDRANARGDGMFDVDSSNPDPYLRIKQWQLINTTTWHATDDLTVKNIISYSQFRERTRSNLYADNFTVTAPFPAAGTPFRYIDIHPAPAAEGDGASQSTFTEELQLQGTLTDGKLIWQLGGYAELSRPLKFSGLYTAILLQCTDVYTVTCANPFGFGFVSNSSTKHSFDNLGLYAQATYKLNNQLSITGGIRYTIDKTRALGQSTRRFPLPNGGVQIICDDSLRFTGTVTSPSQCRNVITEKSKRPTWLIDLDYKPVDDVLLYAKYSRGYRQGGVIMTNIGLETFGPEKLDAYEVGAKASFSGPVSGYFNIAGFYNDFTDQQIFGGLDPKPGITLFGNAVINAGKSRIKGVEVEASLSPVSGLRFDLGYTYLRTKLIDFDIPVLPPESPFATINPSAVKGSVLALSPKNRLTLTGTYTLPLDETIGEVSLGATYTHTDEQVGNASSPLGLLPATDLLNLNVNWKEAFGQPVDLAFFVTNVTNEVYPVQTNGSITTAGFDSFVMGQPRMWGFRLRYSFGE